MNICICGPINPYFIKEYLYNEQYIPNINKAANAVNTYILELLRAGHSVTVITAAVPGDDKDQVLRGERLLIHIVHSNPGIFVTHALSRFYMIRRLRKVLKTYISHVDILHVQWTYDFALAAKPYVKKIPVFCTVRDWCPYIISVQKGLKKIQWYLYYFIFLRVMNCKEIHFIANSEYTYQSIKNKYPEKDTCIIYNPIDKKYILQSKKNKIEVPTFISIAGDLSEVRKNIDSLIQAFHVFHEKYPTSVLKLVGENKGLRYKYSNSDMLEGVELCGILNHDDTISEIDLSTCLIHPSLEETFGNILIEGMARRVVVIGGKNSGAVPKVLEGGKIGILCDVRDISSIVESMQSAIDVDIARKLTKEASEVLVSKYSSDNIMNQHIDLYKQYL